MSKVAEELPHTRHGWWSHWTVTLAILAICIIVSAAALGEGQSVEQMLGEWRTGLLVLGGAALLFSYTVWMNAYFRLRQDLVAAELRQHRNRGSLDGLERRISKTPKSSRD